MNQRPKYLIAPWIALCLSFGLTACASSMATTEPQRPRGLIDLNARMPVGQSPYGIAYGAPTAARVKPATPDLDPYLKPAFSKPATAKKTVVAARPVPLQSPMPVAKASIQSAKLAPAPFEPVVKLEPNQDQLLALAAVSAPQPAPVPADGQDATRYADREAQNQELEQFRGGEAIVITSGALIIALLIVILILLLT